MIIKSLELENIRSYNNTDSPIEIPEGITLFEGDVGAGKSSILYAIEFALFGLGDFKGSFLLRNGAAKGTVILKFEEAGVEYEVGRSLARSGKGFKQDGCYIRGPSGKQVLSATELKERVLQILKFNEPRDAKAQSVIYRYAIFTPQEEMRDILKPKDSETRLQTLRKAFNIESYKIAIENSKAISRKVVDRISFLGGMVEDLPEKKTALESNREQAKRLDESIAPLEEKESLLTKQRKAIDEEWKGLDKQREELEKSQDKIPLLSKQMQEKSDRITKLKDTVKGLETKLRNKIEPEIERLQKLKKPTTLSLDQLKMKKEEAARELKNLLELKHKASESASQIPLLQRNLVKAQKGIRDENDTLDAIEKKLKEIEADIKRLEKVAKPTSKSQAQLKQDKKDLEQKLKKVEGQQARVEERISDFNKMIDGKKCPVCERAVDSQVSDKRAHFKQELKELLQKGSAFEGEIKEIDDVLSRLEDYDDAQDKLAEVKKSEKDFLEREGKAKKAIKEYQDDARDLESKMDDARKESAKLVNIEQKITAAEEEAGRLQEVIDAVKSYDQEQKNLDRLLADRKEANDALEVVRSEIFGLQKEIDEIQRQIRRIESDAKPLKSIFDKMAVLQKQLEDIDAKLQKLSKDVTEAKTSARYYQETIAELEAEVQKKEGILRTVDLLEEHRAWLDEYFSPSLGNIERHVMESIRKRFNDQFERWFSVLMEDQSLQVSVNENFTPEIERDGYIQDYVALSGGERTSVALAYRLALNTLVHEVVAGGSSDLLILDEPTDGFSKEQLFRLREILHELKCRQVIIVSHERELEGFANTIFKIENGRGVSKILAHSK